MGETTTNSTSFWMEAGAMRQGISISQGNPARHAFVDLPSGAYNDARTAAAQASDPPTAADFGAVRDELTPQGQTFWDGMTNGERADWMTIAAELPPA